MNSHMQFSSLLDQFKVSLVNFRVELDKWEKMNGIHSDRGDLNGDSLEKHIKGAQLSDFLRGKVDRAM